MSSRMLGLSSGTSIDTFMALFLAAPTRPFQIAGFLQSRTSIAGLSLGGSTADRSWRDIGICAQAGLTSPPVPLEDISAVVRIQSPVMGKCGQLRSLECVLAETACEGPVGEIWIRQSWL